MGAIRGYKKKTKPNRTFSQELLAKLMCALVPGRINWGGLVLQWHLGKLTKIYGLFNIFPLLFAFSPALWLLFFFFFFCTLKLLPMYLRAHILKISSEELSNDCSCPFCACIPASENCSAPQWKSRCRWCSSSAASPYPWALWMSSCSCRNSVTEPLLFLLRRFVCLKCITTTVKQAGFGTVRV